MEQNIKSYSDMERYELINVNDGDKYGFLGNNDVVVDGDGYLKFLILSESGGKLGLFSKPSLLEVSWDYVRKIGARTIIIDAEKSELKKNPLGRW
ncbi:YlmC/YmxH family sporulation protein [Clostridium botulinum]|nr:YlmC/YmxH family sporulation protein [Clostridium botulinum]MBO0551469.1 YlmC/YmxH family sporulation protein [Clostridium botulinum]MBO0566598.1 YlmC/YmxH family sporulation protein [Clostridium botulinum]MBO0585442.1 YlmC/YmxH family sporulation protein [Clostridium botulinum]